MNYYLERLAHLTRCEWALREQSSFTGFLWTLLHPALMFAALYLLFAKWMGKFTQEYFFFLLIGILQWNFFSACTGYSLSSLVRRAGLVRNFVIPIEMPVLAAALSETISHAIEMALLLLLLIISGRGPHRQWLLLVPIEFVLIFFAFGLSFILAWAHSLYRDTERIWGILTNVVFFLTPVFYTLDIISQGRRAILKLNPMVPIMESSRAILVPGPDKSFGMPAVCCITAIVTIFGFCLLRKTAGTLRDNLY